MLIAVLCLGIGYALLTSPPVRFPDSPGYVGDPAQLEGFFSLTGDASRAWPTVLAYWVAGSDFGRAALQSTLYALAWSALLATWLHGRSQAYVLATGGLLTTLALTPLALQWNLTILAESLTISLAIGGIATLRVAIAVSKGKTNREGWRGIAWFIVGTLLLSLAAVNRFPLTGLMLVPAVCAFILWQRDRYKWPQLAIAGLIVTVGAVYPLMYNQVTNTHWSGDGAYPSRSSLNFLLLSATGAPQPAWADPLWQTVAEQAPECLEGLRGSFLEGETSPWARADEMATACPAGVAWLNDNFSSEYAQFMLANPRSTARYVATMIGGVADPVAYARVKSPLPQAVSTIFEADRSRNADFQPIAGWLMVTAVMVGTIAVTRVRWSKGLLLASAVALGGLVSVIASVLMIMTESVRTTSPATIALLTGCILVLGESVRLIQRRSQPDD